MTTFNLVIAHPRLTTILILVIGVLLAPPLEKGIVTEILGFAKAGVRAGRYHVTVQTVVFDKVFTTTRVRRCHDPVSLLRWACPRRFHLFSPPIIWRTDDDDAMRAPST